tara:strand:+ start:22524 stop:22709 length:186 start_codon:yes stop_codon:yes gene_type:complete
MQGISVVCMVLWLSCIGLNNMNYAAPLSVSFDLLDEKKRVEPFSFSEKDYLNNKAITVTSE